MLKLLFMPDGDAGGMGGQAAPVDGAGADTSTGDGDTGASDGEAETGSVTPDEVAAALKGKGIHLQHTMEDAAKGATADNTGGDENAEDKPGDSEHADDDADTGGDADGGQDNPADKPEAIQKDKPQAAEVAAETPDFSFEVEDNNGAKITIKPGDKIEDVLKDFEPKSNGQIIAILDQLREAKDNAAGYEKEQTEAKETADKQERVTAIRQGWDNEFKQLAHDKLVDGTDATRKDAILDYMKTENTRREEAGIPYIASLTDAYRGLKEQEDKQAADTKAKEAKEQARKNGGLVGGSSAPASGGEKLYVPGSARNAKEAVRVMGLR